MRYAASLQQTVRERIGVLTDTLCQSTGLGYSILGVLILNDSKFLRNVEHGKSCTVTQYDRYVSSLSAIWPSDVPWPESVPRPVPADLSPEHTAMVRAKIEQARKRLARQREKGVVNG